MVSCLDELRQCLRHYGCREIAITIEVYADANCNDTFAFHKNGKSLKRLKSGDRVQYSNTRRPPSQPVTTIKTIMLLPPHLHMGVLTMTYDEEFYEIHDMCCYRAWYKRHQRQTDSELLCTLVEKEAFFQCK